MVWSFIAIQRAPTYGIVGKTAQTTVKIEDSAGIGATWHDGSLYIVSGPETRKSRNLAANPACTISVAVRA